MNKKQAPKSVCAEFYQFHWGSCRKGIKNEKKLLKKKG